MTDSVVFTVAGVSIEMTLAATGPRGKSAYQVALDNGFVGNEAAWLASLTGPSGISAYQVAVANGFVGNEAAWLASLQGDAGLSAYEVAVTEGFVGTEAEWLESLIGDEGASAYEVAVANGFVGNEAAWLASLQGDAGLSAYEVAVTEGFVGTEAEWLESLIGDEGDSAYEVAVANGFVGNEAAWLASLEGADGAAGNSLMRPAATLTSSAGVVTVNLASGTEVYELTLTENVTSWSFTNLPASGFVAEIRIDIVQHASAAKTCVSPATAGTAGGAWTVSSVLSSRESLGIAINSAGARQLYPSEVLE